MPRHHIRTKQKLEKLVIGIIMQFFYIESLLGLRRQKMSTKQFSIDNRRVYLN